MAHIHEKIDFTVEVFVVFEGRVLLRKHEKYGIWLSVGGHVELDEDPNQAAVREVKEEVGLAITLFDTREYKGDGGNVTQLIPPMSLNRHRISDTHEHITLVYSATTDSDQVIPEKETDQWKWCTKEEVDSIEGITEEISYFAKKAIENVARAQYH